MHLTQLMEFYLNMYQNRVSEIRKMLSKYPEGELQCHKNGASSFRFRIRHKDGSREELTKKDKPRRLSMTQKAVLEAELADTEFKLQCCKVFLNRSSQYPHALEHLLENDGIRGILLQESAQPVSDRPFPKALSNVLLLFDADRKTSEWVNASYPKNPNYPEDLKIPTITGEYVRSKIEAMVVELLVHMKIPFRYEQEYIFDGKKYYPDFTLLDPKTGRIYILEIFGIMDDPKYSAQAGSKIALYARNGFVLTQNLLCFCETKEEPFDIGLLMINLQYMMGGNAA